MKVLKQGREIKVKCKGCGAKLSIEDGDIVRYDYVLNDYDGYIICPCCNEKIEMTRSVFTNKWVQK